MDLNKITQHIEDNFDSHIEELIQLCKIPSISFPNFDPATCKENAQMVAELFKRIKLENVQVLEIEGGHPFAYADYCHAPGKPTVLLYGHYDVQPIGNENIWESKPFEPVIKEGKGGLRLYGRGTADDKAAIITHTALLSAFFETGQEPPVNIKVLIEGEEEVGSAHFPDLVKKHRELLKADVMLVPDNTAIDCGQPSLTSSLRGMAGFEITLKGMDKPLHSGMWGGFIPDPAMALSKILASLVDENGMIAVPEIKAMIPQFTKEEEEALSKFKFDEKDAREKAGLLEKTQLIKHCDYPHAQLWKLPHLAINAFEASKREQAGNIIVPEAWARITVRTPSTMKAKDVEAALKKHLIESTPWGLTIELEAEDHFDGWQVDTEGKDKKYFDAAMIALQKGFDHEVVLQGCGAAIPLVKTFADSYNAPVLLLPMHDPYSYIHSENESLLISDFKKMILSEMHLFEELGKMA